MLLFLTLRPHYLSRPSIFLQFGTTTLAEHYQRIALEGNDYDPYTTLFAGKKKPTGMIASLLGSGEKETVRK